MVFSMDDIKLANELDGSYNYLSDSQELEALKESIGLKNANITGAFVKASNGDYLEVWLTESSRPYHVNAPYWRYK